MIEHVQHHLLNGENHQTLQSWDQSRNGTEEIFRRIHDVMWRDNILSISKRNSFTELYM